MKFYLAGKISGESWRTKIVGDPWSWPDGAKAEIEERGRWPILRGAIFGHHDYVGPYFMECGHGSGSDQGCYGKEDGHGVDAEEYGGEDDANGCGGSGFFYTRKDVVDLCLESVGRADVVFVWLDQMDSFGTLIEVGYAKAQGKEIWVAGPNRYFRDLWFAYKCANRTYFSASTAADALRYFLERVAYETCLQQIDGYVYLLRSGDAYKIGRARSVDDRVKQISPVMPYPIEVIHTIPSNNVVRAEREFHQQFAAKRLKGEWFSLDARDLMTLRCCQEKIYVEGEVSR